MLERDVLGVLVERGAGASLGLAARACVEVLAEEVLEDGLEVLHVGVLSAAGVEAVHVAEDVLVLEAGVGIVLGRAGLVVVLAPGGVGECFVGAEWQAAYLLISANLSLALGLGFLSGCSSWASL